MGRQLGCIVVISILGMIALVAMAGYGTSHNPRLWLKAAIESDLPIAFEAYTVTETRERLSGTTAEIVGRRLTLRVVPREGAAADAALAERVALAALRAFERPEAPRVSCTSLAVTFPDGATHAFDKEALRRQRAREAIRWRRPPVPPGAAGPAPATPSAR